MSRKWWALAAVPVIAVAAYAAAGGDNPAETVAPAAQTAAEHAVDGPAMVVYKSPTCGCCADWVEHVREHGFAVEVHDMSQGELMQVKLKHGIRANMASCHTALVDGYVFEGHVPADLIQRFLDERPAKIGLAVPGMPAGSPGMEMGARKDPYDVIAIDSAGGTVVYESR